MISAGDFRNGVTIEFEGNIYQIIEYQHVKPGKGAAFVRTKLNRASLSSLIRPFYNKKQYISSIYFLLHEFVLVLY